MYTVSKTISVLASAANQDLLANLPGWKQYVVTGGFSLAASMDTGAKGNVSIQLQVGANVLVNGGEPNATGNPPRTDYDTIVAGVGGVIGTPIILTASNADAANAYDVTITMVQQAGQVG